MTDEHIIKNVSDRTIVKIAMQKRYIKALQEIIKTREATSLESGINHYNAAGKIMVLDELAKDLGFKL